MTTHYLRLEGVNLANFVFDTKDLNTIRGGGLLMLEATTAVVKACPRLRPISIGASAGLYSFDAIGTTPTEVASDVANLRQQVESFLVGRRVNAQEMNELRHATFVVSIVPSAPPEGFVRDRERLLALNRWKQMRAPSVAVPASTPGAQDPCRVDRIRPGVPGLAAGQRHPISASVGDRRVAGQEAKRGAFYRDRGGTDVEVAPDLDTLTADPEQGNLDHKMAVIYIDGNRFGPIQQQVCTTEAVQKSFDQDLREKRASMLKALLAEAAARSTFHWKEPALARPRPLRFETLMWGGDEMLWVVPAWEGWWTLGRFYDLTKGWESIVPGPDPAAPKPALRHAAGMVFCHHSAPIHRIKALAMRLADEAKTKDRNANLVAYQVLESFDHAGPDLGAFRARFLPQGATLANLVLDGECLAQAAEEFAKVKDVIPRRKLHAAVQSYLRPEAPGVATTSARPSVRTVAVPATAESAVALIRAELSPLQQDALTRLLGHLGDEPTAWIHLAQLWDYLG